MKSSMPLQVWLGLLFASPFVYHHSIPGVGVSFGSLLIGFLLSRKVRKQITFKCQQIFKIFPFSNKFFPDLCYRILRFLPKLTLWLCAEGTVSHPPPTPPRGFSPSHWSEFGGSGCRSIKEIRVLGETAIHRALNDW